MRQEARPARGRRRAVTCPSTWTRWSPSSHAPGPRAQPREPALGRVGALSRVQPRGAGGQRRCAAPCARRARGRAARLRPRGARRASTAARSRSRRSRRAARARSSRTWSKARCSRCSRTAVARSGRDVIERVRGGVVVHTGEDISSASTPSCSSRSRRCGAGRELTGRRVTGRRGQRRSSSCSRACTCRSASTRTPRAARHLPRPQLMPLAPAASSHGSIIWCARRGEPALISTPSRGHRGRAGSFRRHRGPPVLVCRGRPAGMSTTRPGPVATKHGLLNARAAARRPRPSLPVRSRRELRSLLGDSVRHDAERPPPNRVTVGRPSHQRRSGHCHRTLTRCALQSAGVTGSPSPLRPRRGINFAAVRPRALRSQRSSTRAP